MSRGVYTEPTLEEAVDAGRLYGDRLGMAAVRALVRSFGVERLRDLPPAGYGAFIAACRMPLPPLPPPTPTEFYGYGAPIQAARTSEPSGLFDHEALKAYLETARAAAREFYSPVRLGLDWGTAEPIVTTWRMSSEDARACKHPTLFVARAVAVGVYEPDPFLVAK